MVITKEKPFLIIDSKLQEIIRANLADLVVYTRKAPIDSCELFTSLHENFKNKLYVLREFDNSQKDRTLNRCSLYGKAFTPEKFKLGAPTPGRENDCNGPHFFLETILPELNDPIQNQPIDSHDVDKFDSMFEQSDSPKCTSSVPASIYQSLPDDTIEKIIEHESEIASTSSCSALNLAANSGNIADEADRIRDYLAIH